MSAIRKQNIKIILGGTLLLSGLLPENATAANDFTAEKVMKEMNGQQQVAYFAGVIEGLAVARYHKDGKKKEGMACIYDWFYDDKANLKVIMDAFDRYPTYPPGAIVDVLVKRKCGE